MITLSFWPILVASVVSFAIGSLWYSPVLFGKQWMALNNMSDADVSAAQAKGIWKLYIVQFIVTVITFIILGFFIRTTGTYTGIGGAFMGLLAWLGFVATTSVGGLLWEKKPLRLVIINLSSALLTFVIGGAILGAWN